MRASASVTVSCEIAKAFVAFSDLEKRPKFLSAITELKLLTKESAGTGTKWHETRYEDDIEKEGTVEVTQYKPPRILVLDIHSMGLVYRVRYNFQPEGSNTTKIVATIGGKQRGLLARFMKKFLSGSGQYVHERLQNELDAFKHYIEK